MSTIAIGIADSHFTDKKPRSRLDDYQATQLFKLEKIMQLASLIKWEGVTQKAVSICFAGDICHQPKGKLVSRKLDVRLIRALSQSPCPIHGILGNHDKDKDRDDSIEEHTLGSLVASDILKLVHWPEYVVVGDDPPVIITGRQYEIESPKAWLEHLRNSKQLIDLKKAVSDKTGKNARALVMTHNYWGPNDGLAHADPIVGHNNIIGTGADVILYGHPHTDDGVVEVMDGDWSTKIVGPGAMTRGTIAEVDTQRKPKIAVMIFYNDKPADVLTVPIPHEPAEKVFDMVRHARQRSEKRAEEQFIDALKATHNKMRSPEEILTAAEDKTPVRVVALTRQYMVQAAESLK